MGKPAARMGDTVKTCNDPADMPVGKIIAAGNVMINKLPAAKQGDQVIGVDIHIVLIPSPGGPVPTPLPHPFAGMLDGQLSSSVKIMGMPAAIVGSTASNMPPHIPQGGPFQKPPSNKGEIILGSPNVIHRITAAAGAEEAAPRARARRPRRRRPANRRKGISSTSRWSTRGGSRSPA